MEFHLGKDEYLGYIWDVSCCDCLLHVAAHDFRQQTNGSLATRISMDGMEYGTACPEHHL